jgi:hypothetical protein
MKHDHGAYIVTETCEAWEAWQAALQRSGEPVGVVDERLHDLSERLRATDSQNRYLSLSEQHEICDFIDDLPEGNLYATPQPVSEDARDAQRFRQLEDIFAGLKVSRSKNVLEALGFHEADPYGTLAQALLSAGKETV